MYGYGSSIRQPQSAHAYKGTEASNRLTTTAGVMRTIGTRVSSLATSLTSRAVEGSGEDKKAKGGALPEAEVDSNKKDKKDKKEKKEKKEKAEKAKRRRAVKKTPTVTTATTVMTPTITTAMMVTMKNLKVTETVAEAHPRPPVSGR